MDATAQGMVRGEVGGHRRADERAAGVVEAVAERGVARQHDVDDALRRVGQQLLGQAGRKQR